MMAFDPPRSAWCPVAQSPADAAVHRKGRPGSARGQRCLIAFRFDPCFGVRTFPQLFQRIGHALRLGYVSPGVQAPKVRDVVA